MDTRKNEAPLWSTLETTGNTSIEKQAAIIIRSFGAGSVQYQAFLEKANSSLAGLMLDLPKYVPGDVRKPGQSAKNKKRRHKSAAKLPSVKSMEEIPIVQGNKEEIGQSLTLDNNLLPQSPMTPKLETPIIPIKEQCVWDSKTTTRPTSIQKSLTQVERKGEGSEEKGRTLRRTQSSFPNEQVTMDEQVALQLQSLLREKAELLKENSRLKNENAGLHELLQYATCEASGDEADCSDHEDMISKEAIRRSGIQAWHPPELYTPDSSSSFGVGSSSSADEKEAHI